MSDGGFKYYNNYIYVHIAPHHDFGIQLKMPVDVKRLVCMLIMIKVIIICIHGPTVINIEASIGHLSGNKKHQLEIDHF
jgi:hypothetical protein